MNNDLIRSRLDRLIQNSDDEDYASISLLLGRNHAYIQQFIKRGIPKALRFGDREKLAFHFNVPLDYLDAAPGFSESASTYITPNQTLFITYYDVHASAGPGALNDYDTIQGSLPFSKNQLRDLGCTNPEHLAVLKVNGDSMSPTLNNGDDILLNTNIESIRRDGIYVIRNDGALLVKRISVNPVTGLITVKSDNPLYENWENCPTDSIDLIGRVIWIGRKL